MTTANRINKETNPVNRTEAAGYDPNPEGYMDFIIQKAYLRPEYAVLLSGGVPGALIRQAASRSCKVYLAADPSQTANGNYGEPGSLANVEFLLPSEMDSLIPPESMDAVIAVANPETGSQPLPFMKTMAALLRPAGYGH